VDLASRRRKQQHKLTPSVPQTNRQRKRQSDVAPDRAPRAASGAEADEEEERRLIARLQAENQQRQRERLAEQEKQQQQQQQQKQQRQIQHRESVCEQQRAAELPPQVPVRRSSRGLALDPQERHAPARAQPADSSSLRQRRLATRGSQPLGLAVQHPRAAPPVPALPAHLSSGRAHTQASAGGPAPPPSWSAARERHLRAPPPPPRAHQCGPRNVWSPSSSSLVSSSCEEEPAGRRRTQADGLGSSSASDERLLRALESPVSPRSASSPLSSSVEQQLLESELADCSEPGGTLCVPQEQQQQQESGQTGETTGEQVAAGPAELERELRSNLAGWRGASLEQTTTGATTTTTSTPSSETTVVNRAHKVERPEGSEPQEGPPSASGEGRPPRSSGAQSPEPTPSARPGRAGAHTWRSFSVSLAGARTGEAGELAAQQTTGTMPRAEGGATGSGAHSARSRSLALGAPQWDALASAAASAASVQQQCAAAERRQCASEQRRRLSAGASCGPEHAEDCAPPPSWEDASPPVALLEAARKLEPNHDESLAADLRQTLPMLLACHSAPLVPLEGGRPTQLQQSHSRPRQTGEPSESDSQPDSSKAHQETNSTHTEPTPPKAPTVAPPPAQPQEARPNAPRRPLSGPDRKQQEELAGRPASLRASHALDKQPPGSPKTARDQSSAFARQMYAQMQASGPPRLTAERAVLSAVNERSARLRDAQPAGQTIKIKLKSAELAKHKQHEQGLSFGRPGGASRSLPAGARLPGPISDYLPAESSLGQHEQNLVSVTS